MWFVLVLSLIFFQDSLGDLVVQLKDGKVQGTTINTPGGRTFYTWRGIPYGKPPLDKLRYLPPLKAEPWTGIKDASNDSPACVFFGSWKGDPVPTNGESEDCLYANVYSPITVGSNSSVNVTLSVMFWIYGGGFFAGTGDFAFYDPTPFLEEDVIVVTFNYRLGYFGFLSTGDDVILGNAGLKDQLLALQWTRDNIAAFGGNPEDITIFGESAGGRSVGYHIVSPLSRNLFKGAIIESGSSISDMIQADGRQSAYTLASKVDSSITNSSTSEQVRDVLQAAPVDLLVNLTKGTRVGAVIEVKSNLSFLSSPLYDTLESGDIARVPLVIGHNSEEYLIYANDWTILQQETNRADLNPQILVPTMSLKENVSTKVIGEEIHEKYVGKDKLFSENFAAYLNFASDNKYVRSLYKHAILQSRFSPVYMYRFAFYGTQSKDNIDVPGAGRVGHAQELGYLFNITTKPIKTEQDYLTRKRLVKLWTNFAKTSNPTPDDDDSAEILQNVKWQPLTEEHVQYLNIDENLQMESNRRANETVFWNYIWETYANRPYNNF